MSEELIAALRDYQQADEDGVMVLVSRQACEEAAAEIERLRAELFAARSAALEEAAAHLDWRQEATRMAGVKCKEIGSDDDAVRYNHYSQAHEAAASAIRELKDK